MEKAGGAMEDRPKVLLVDDEKLMRLAVRHRLTGEGFQVDATESATEALTVLRERDYDVVVTDLRCEGTSGLDVVREVRRLQPGAGVILLTGSAEPDELEAALHAGAASVLVTPCALSDLSQEARRIARRRRRPLEPSP
jgi:DNA-binding NtrC family response regulator